MIKDVLQIFSSASDVGAGESGEESASGIQQAASVSETACKEETEAEAVLQEEKSEQEKRYEKILEKLGKLYPADASEGEEALISAFLAENEEPASSENAASSEKDSDFQGGGRKK